MPKFLTVKSICAEIENIIREAKSEITLISPYIQIDNSIYLRLLKRDKKVKLKVYCRKQENKKEEIEKLIALNNVDLYNFENLHAKLYMNEDKMILTSLNLYEYSQTNNYELGILIEKEKDTALFNEILAEVAVSFGIESKKVSKVNSSAKGIIADTTSLVLKLASSISKSLSDNGFCIRCSSDISFDVDRPYCKECYRLWAQYENDSYPEKFCHGCKKSNKSTMLKPICYKCYKA